MIPDSESDTFLSAMDLLPVGLRRGLTFLPLHPEVSHLVEGRKGISTALADPLPQPGSQTGIIC